MNNSVYLSAKETLKAEAKRLKKSSNDKPLIRMSLNDLLDSLCRGMSLSCSDKQYNLYSKWLQNYVCSLHP